MTETSLTRERYLELIDADTDRLIAMGERGKTEPVPSCKGWDVAEVLWHTAEVYKHKVQVMAHNSWPQEWPPPEDDNREEIGLLREAKTDLLAEFARHEVGEQTTTFGTDTTIGFWIRRMALEIAVHRYDAELAHRDTTPIDRDLAVDGIDEALQVMLAGYGWDEEQTEHPVEAPVAIETGGRRWLCDVQRTKATVTLDATDPAVSTDPAVATVSGRPEKLFLWLWGRVGDDEIDRSGDERLIADFRGRLVECMG